MLSTDEIIELKNKNPKHYVKMLKKRFPETWNEIEKFCNNIGEIESSAEKVYVFLNGITNIPKCLMCDNRVKFDNNLWQYNKVCSRECAKKLPRVGHKLSEEKRIQAREKREKTNIEKFGSAYPMQSKSIAEKMKNTVLKKYGVEHVLQDKNIHDKMISTIIEKYGVKSVMCLDKFKDKIRKTNRDRYGVDAPIQNREIYNKVKNTIHERYGVDFALCNDEIYFRFKKTLESRYGVDNTTRFAWDKLKKDFYESYKNRFPGLVLLTSLNEYEGIYGKNLWHCDKCGNEFYTEGISGKYPRCICTKSKTEQGDLFKYVLSLGVTAIMNDRSALGNGQEIDVYIPEKKIGIEFDGLYWHSELYHDRNYHIKKTRVAEKHGIRLIHIFEDEWINKRKIVERKIKYLVNGESIKSIFARKCKPDVICSDVAHKFLDKYHIQGSDNSSVYCGLYYGRFLVAVCGFTKTSGKDGGYMISRYATIFTRRIVGGQGKLLKFFIKQYKPVFVRTYADLRVSDGNLYRAIGMELKEVVPPKYWYTNDFKNRIHRFNLRKEKIKKHGMLYDDNLTESELARMNGFYRIWDCGYLVFEIRC